MQYLYSTLRGTAVFLLMLGTIRILGKKELGQLSIFDLVVLLIISDLCSMGIPNGKDFIIGILCLLVLIVLQKFIGLIMKKNKKIRKILDGDPVVFIMDGVIYYDNMSKEGYTIDDLICQVRENAIMDLSEVRLAVLETTGKLSVFSKHRYDKIVLPVVESGEIVTDNLSLLGLKESDLKAQIFNLGYNLSDVIYASSDGRGVFITKIIKSKVEK
ncbi:MAG: DUF421 domain-containing protein [Anaeroplasmataceae bacterium]